jgi:hypothetical protein
MSQYDLNLAVQQYTTNVQLLVQQKGSRLRDTVMIGQHFGKQAVAVDQYAPVTASKVTGRYQPLVPYDTQNDRRWVFPVDYHWNDMIDTFDQLRLLNDPMNAYVQSAVNAMGRAMDDEIIGALFADAKTGENGSTTTSFLSANQIAVGYGASAATGLNVAKLIRAKKILMGYDLDEDEQLFCIITAAQHENLLNEIQVVNSDYNSRPVLVDGKLTSFLGINFVHSERLPVNGSSQRRVPVYAKSGMHLGIWNDIMTRIDERKDLSSIPYQVYAKGTFGATRTEEKKVIEIVCAES